MVSHIHIIDHRDSFTWNVADLFSPFGAVRVWDYESLKLDCISRADCCVLSPGPGHPEAYPKTLELYRTLKVKVPIIGICLGMQIIMHAEGARVHRLKHPAHGVCSELDFDRTAAPYAGIDGPVTVGRYHSLMVSGSCNAASFLMTSSTFEDNVPMSFEHLTLPIYGFQYHPDSYLTRHGRAIIANIFRKLGLRSAKDTLR